jgi:hypothetical protein
MVARSALSLDLVVPAAVANTNSDGSFLHQDGWLLVANTITATTTMIHFFYRRRRYSNVVRQCLVFLMVVIRNCGQQ